MNNEQPIGYVRSYAHDWVSAPSGNTLKCVHCGATTRVGMWGVPRCKEHFESDTSGYAHEAQL